MYEQVDVERDISYAAPGGTPVYLDVFRPAAVEGLPVIMVVHGGGWCLGQRQDVDYYARRFASEGYLAISIGYRLAPASPYPAACEDMLAALAWVRAHAASHGGDPARIGAYGVSAGAHLVSWLATEPQTALTCAVAWAGPTDIRREPVTHPYRAYALAFMADCLRDAPQAYAQASPLLRMTPTMPPLLLIHGLADTIVPPDHARWMSEDATKIGAPVEALLLKDVGHTGGDPDNPLHEPGFQAMDSFFARHLLS